VFKTLELKSRIRELDKNVRFFVHSTKTKTVKRQIIPGNTESLWTAVKASKDINIYTLLNTLFKNNHELQKN
jgi:hypothetical protein